MSDMTNQARTRRIRSIRQGRSAAAQQGRLRRTLERDRRNTANCRTSDTPRHTPNSR